MKKGKKGWLLLMAFTTWAALIAGCGKWTGNKQDKVPEVTMAGSDTENMENPENRALKDRIGDFKRVERALGSDVVETIVQREKSLEEAQRMQNKGRKRKIDRGER